VKKSYLGSAGRAIGAALKNKKVRRAIEFTYDLVVNTDVVKDGIEGFRQAKDKLVEDFSQAKDFIKEKNDELSKISGKGKKYVDEQMWHFMTRRHF